MLNINFFTMGQNFPKIIFALLWNSENNNSQGLYKWNMIPNIIKHYQFYQLLLTSKLLVSSQIEIKYPMAETTNIVNWNSCETKLIECSLSAGWIT